MRQVLRRCCRPAWLVISRKPQKWPKPMNYRAILSGSQEAGLGEGKQQPLSSAPGPRRNSGGRSGRADLSSAISKGRALGRRSRGDPSLRWDESLPELKKQTGSRGCPAHDCFKTQKSSHLRILWSIKTHLKGVGPEMVHSTSVLSRQDPALRPRAPRKSKTKSGPSSHGCVSASL